MKNIFLPVFVFLICIIPDSFGSDNEYNISKISPVNLFGSDAVIRKKITRFETYNESDALFRETIAVTIFNKDGQHYGEKVLWYDKFKEIEELEGKIFNSVGEEIKDLGDDNIEDYSAIGGSSLYTDSRVKVIRFYHNEFPYTIEFTYEISYDGYLSWPAWYSRNNINPVEISRFEVLVPENYNLRFWCNTDSVLPEISNNGRLYTWELKDQQPLSYDIVGEDVEEFATIVRIAPTDFEVEDYKGSMRSWKDFGLWIHELFKNRNILPESAVKEVKNIVSPADNIHQKVSKLYKYLQSRTRYVSVQLGIGGWQPFDAAYVHEKGYGDCKALSNYMVTLLKENGINAYPVVIYRGSNSMRLISEFPNNQFNHVIVCVPADNDTVWLECTSTTAVTGHLGWSNENRQALMITPEGGVLVSTPKSTSGENIQVKNIRIKLTDARAELKGNIRWSGNQHSYARTVAKEETPIEQEKWILSSFKVPDIKINNYSFAAENNFKEETELNLNAVLPRYATISGSRIFFNPNLMERRTYVPKEIPARLSSIRFNYPYLDIDSIYYEIPAGYRIEAMPDDVNISSSFGKFNSKITVLSESEILYVRSLEIKEYSIQPEKYNEYRDFSLEVVKADKAQAVLVKAD